MGAAATDLYKFEPDARAKAIVSALGSKSLVLVGMMGAGKTSVGKRLAARLGLDFLDADAEIESAHRMTIPEIFAKHGEAYFREGERKVVARLLDSGPRVIATGGGAFIHAATRSRIKQQAVSVWLKADFDVLMRRVRKKSNRPLLQTSDPEGTLLRLIEERYHIYAEADHAVLSKDGPHEIVIEDILRILEHDFGLTSPQPPGRDESVPDVTLKVGLGARAYDIVIGGALIRTAGERIAALAPKSNCAIITDAQVAALHLPALQASLDAVGIRHTSIVIPPGEASKSYAQFERLCDAVISAKLERRDLIIALGGGVVGDLAGFVAASVRRGMAFVQMPTSLLAQVDSSVGGKTGINSPFGKNLIGAFHQPALVLADTACLDTLPLREFKAGYAEVAKYGLIDDPEFFYWLEANWRDVFAGGAARQEAIARSCAAKAAVVERDEFETGDRALLNLGHTFGHAFERLTHYDSAKLVHGEGVAVGMACAFRFSVKRGLCSGQDAHRMEVHLRQVGLPTRIRQIQQDLTADALLEAMFQDKKVERGALTFILARGIGQSFIAKNVPADEVHAFLNEELALQEPGYDG